MNSCLHTHQGMKLHLGQTNDVCIWMQMNSCLHTQQSMKLHLYAKPVMYAYGCIWTPAFISNKVSIDDTFMPNKPMLYRYSRNHRFAT